MKNLMCRILLVSDLHNLTVPVGKQKGQKLNFFEKIFEGIINIWKRWNVRVAVSGLLEKIAKFEDSVDMVVLNGDMVECEYNERGMIHESDLLGVIALKHLLRKALKRSWCFVAGDHELGYKLPLSSDPEGGVSLKSISNFEKVLGKLFYGIYGESFNLLFISSTLLLQNWKNWKVGEYDSMQSLKKKQEGFMVDWLMKIREGERVFVFMHDPDAIEQFDVLIRDFYYARNKKFTVFCGHMHADWSLGMYALLGKISESFFKSVMPKKIMAWAMENNRRLKIFRRYDLQIIPAPGGMMGIGGGFKILNVYDNGSYDIERHRL